MGKKRLTSRSNVCYNRHTSKRAYFFVPVFGRALSFNMREAKFIPKVAGGADNES